MLKDGKRVGCPGPRPTTLEEVEQDEFEDDVVDPQE
jgi:hypothetical protein